jgi:hypothetical protein
MVRLEAWLETQFKERLVEPNSGLGKAIKYATKHWAKLTRFLHEPGAPLDNDICYAACGIADVMPLPGICRVTADRRSA